MYLSCLGGYRIYCGCMDVGNNVNRFSGKSKKRKKFILVAVGRSKHHKTCQNSGQVITSPTVAVDQTYPK